MNAPLDHDTSLATPRFSVRRALATLLMCALVVPFGDASRAASSTVSIVPADTTVTVGDVFTVRASLDAATDLKGYSLGFASTAGVLSLEGATAGTFMTNYPGDYTFFPLADATPHDSLRVDAARLDGSTSGSGVLAVIQCRALAVGNSPVTITGALFRSSTNASSYPGLVNGLVRVAGPTPALRSSWGRLKALVR